MHADRDRDMIIARVCTVDPRDATRYNYFHYAAHHLNKILFRTEPERGLLHRVRTKNPLSNDSIYGKVDYFVIKASIARAWSDAHRNFKKQQKHKTHGAAGAGSTSSHGDDSSLSVKIDDPTLPTLHKLPSDATILSRWTTRTFMEVTIKEPPDVLDSGRCTPVPIATPAELTHIKVVSSASASPSPSPVELSPAHSDAISESNSANAASSVSENSSKLSFIVAPLLSKTPPRLPSNTRISLDRLPSNSSSNNSHRSASAPSSPLLSSSPGLLSPCPKAVSISRSNSERKIVEKKCCSSSFIVPSTSTLAKEKPEEPVTAISTAVCHAQSTLPRSNSLPALLFKSKDASADLQHTYHTAAQLRKPSRAIPAIEMGNTEATGFISPLQPRTGPNWLVGRYIGNDYDFLYKAPIRQFFAKNALEPDDALLFPLHSRPRPVLPHHRWMRPLAPLLRFDSDQIGSVMDGEFPRPEEQVHTRINPMTNMNWRERVHYTFTTGLFDCLRHRRTRWFTVIYIAAAIGIVLFFIPPASVIIVGVALLFVFLIAFAWALAAYC
ncbi:hypothetical protein BDF19DRAFT_314878 [Syncephalis fuscata]|nr:hypothetical protein BDF19DRAFT_314878 [Syncephalis fuscata]